MNLKKILILIVILSYCFFVGDILAQETFQASDLQKKINEYQNKLSELSQQKNTLSSQIQYMDTQIYLTNLKIQDTEQKIISTSKEIDILESRVENLDQSLDHLSRLLLDKIVQGYKQREISLFSFLFDSKNVDDLINKIKYVKIARDNNQRLIVEVQQAKSNFEEQKKLREEKKIELDKLTEILNYQKQSLNNQKTQKQRLLADTQNDEAIYQNLLSQARAQLAGFSKFVNSQGGASILSNQTVCDDWGCYYNQRDSQWGNVIINNRYDCDGSCSISRVGCLVTSVAMVASHLGNRNILPSDIANNSTNFWPNTAWLNKGTISANGVNITRTTISGSLSPDLLQNGPVIVGINYGPFGTHFVVVKNYSNGNYIINDPYTEGGKDKNFTDYYSLDSVFEVDRISL